MMVFPRYLEQAAPGTPFQPGGVPDWIDARVGKSCELTFTGAHASFSYHPESAGNYLARWQAGTETFYRYFSVVENDSIVLAFSTFIDLESEPTLHSLGIPLDYRLPVEHFQPEDPLFQKFLGYHRLFGDTIMAGLPDTPGLSAEERIKQYGEGLERARGLLPDPSSGRSARLEMHHDLDPGYTDALAQLGVNDHCGLWEANAKPWLGMPEFPYFASSIDCRKANQAPGGAVVAHQWDFCGGWHFLGPVSWHYGAADRQWEATEHCLRQGLAEAKNLAELSGHPAFLTPLYDGVTTNHGFAGGQLDQRFADHSDMARFVEHYQRFMAFEMTRTNKLVFTRTVDIADFYRRHYKSTPRTIFVSKTDHLHYDMWWLCDWYNRRNLLTRERLPWWTRTSTIHQLRKTAHPFKDPLAVEYVLIEDQQRSIRFERECPNPIWWFDYRIQDRGPEGSAITHVETPDVDILHTGWTPTANGQTIVLTMKTDAEFPDYAILLWAIPTVSKCPVLTTNAKEWLIARNTDGETHLALFFDLKPGVEIEVTVEG